MVEKKGKAQADNSCSGNPAELKERDPYNSRGFPSLPHSRFGFFPHIFVEYNAIYLKVVF